MNATRYRLVEWFNFVTSTSEIVITIDRNHHRRHLNDMTPPPGEGDVPDVGLLEDGWGLPANMIENPRQNTSAVGKASQSNFHFASTFVFLFFSVKRKVKVNFAPLTPPLRH